MLEISELYQRFGDRVAVDKLSLAVNGGEIVGLVGRNGAGKTTTMAGSIPGEFSTPALEQKTTRRSPRKARRWLP